MIGRRIAQGLRQRYPRAWSFLARRLSPREYLGLPLTVGLILSGLACGLFGMVVVDVARKGRLVQFDQVLAARFERHAKTSPTSVRTARVITVTGHRLILAGIAVGMACAVFLCGRRRLALVVLVALVSGGLLTHVLKEMFPRERPPSHDPSSNSEGSSFPSGHAMNGLMVYGMLAYLLVLVGLHRWWPQVAAVLGLAALETVIAFSRLYLRAHYFSDVLAGFAAGGFWLAVCITGIEVVRRRRPPPPELSVVPRDPTP